MRIDNGEHTRHPWRIDEIAPDFTLVDAWAIPASGTAAEFIHLHRLWWAEAPTTNDTGLSGGLFKIRDYLGRRLGWDDKINTLPIPGSTKTSLRDRLPADLSTETADRYERAPFRPIYLTGNESAAELSNSILHAVLHLGWAPQPDGTYRGQLGVYVKHRGRLGRPYLMFIAPFRHRIVYPALMRRVDTAWKRRRA